MKRKLNKFLLIISLLWGIIPVAKASPSTNKLENPTYPTRGYMAENEYGGEVNIFINDDIKRIRININGVNYVRDVYQETLNAINLWSSASGNMRMQIVENESDANVIISGGSDNEGYFARSTPRGYQGDYITNRVGRIRFNLADFAEGGTAGRVYRAYDSLEGPTYFSPEIYADILIRIVIIHEFGHVFGYAHAGRGNGVMIIPGDMMSRYQPLIMEQGEDPINAYVRSYRMYHGYNMQGADDVQIADVEAAAFNQEVLLCYATPNNSTNSRAGTDMAFLEHGCPQNKIMFESNEIP